MFISDALTCVRIINEIISTGDEVKQNNEMAFRLAERCKLLKFSLEQLVQPIKNLSDVKKRALKTLEETLTQIVKYLKKLIAEKNAALVRRLKVAITSAAYRKHISGKIGMFNNSLNECSLTLNLISDMEIEAQRAEDLADSKAYFERCMNLILDNINDLGKFTTYFIYHTFY